MNEISQAVRGPSHLKRLRARVLVVEDDAAMRELLREALDEDGYEVETAAGGRPGVERVRQGGIDLVISDVKMPDLDGLDMLREIKACEPAPYVITITAFGSIDTAIRAVKLGAFDYITKPFEIDQLLLAVEKALGERELRSEVARLRNEVERSYRFDNIIGRSPSMQEIFGMVRRLAGSSASVLVTGDSGTGKELIARSLHFSSPRKNRPFVPLNCAAIPDTLLESELFGVKRGAFTDARSDRAGIFAEADGGTIFLDEIAELSPALQAKLLRVLQDREIRPLGGSGSEKVDVRVIAATNRDLDRRLKDGTFREDLYYRLNVIHIHLPPLRERPEDILALCEHFLAAASARTGKPISGLAEPAKQALLGYAWPGNVRELENVVERAVALAEGDTIRLGDLPSTIRERKPVDNLGSALSRGLTLDELAREYIERVVQAEGGNKTRAAQKLGLDRKTLYRKLEEYSAAVTAVGAEVDVKVDVDAEAEAEPQTPPPIVKLTTPLKGTKVKVKMKTETKTKTLTRSDRSDPGAGSVTFAGVACRRGDLLRSPVSDAVCVHWRLRIAERVNASLQLVHEIASTEDFDLTWAGSGGEANSAWRGGVRIRVASQTACIQATPVLHRPGSPGALAVGRQFGFSGQLSVEEVTLREGEEIVAEGILEEPPLNWSGPFRGVEREIELLGATVRLPARATLGPVLLPWALGTAAALLGGVGVATWAAWRFDLVPQLRPGGPAPPAEMGPRHHVRRHFSRPE